MWLPRPPQQRNAEHDQRQPGGSQREAGPVVAAHAARARIRDRERESLDRQDAECQREHRAQPRGRQCVTGDGDCEQRERHEARHGVVGRLHARLERDERIHDRVESDDGSGGGEDVAVPERHGADSEAAAQ